jgi:hypothetical protein
MDTDRTRELARLERMEQELGLLRMLEKDVLRYWHKTQGEDHAGVEAEWSAVTDALCCVAFWRKEHSDAT